MEKAEYYGVSSGNWKVKVKLFSAPDDNAEIEDFTYIEAATRAMEVVFGKAEFCEDCEIYSLIDMSGNEFFDSEYRANDSGEVPRPMFSIITVVYRMEDEHDEKRYRIYLTRNIFANAAQFVNVELAAAAEAEDPKAVAKFNRLASKLKRNHKKNKKDS